MRLLRTLFLATLLGTALFATADDEGYESYGKKEDYPIDGAGTTATVSMVMPCRGGPDPEQEVRASVRLSCLGLGGAVCERGCPPDVPPSYRFLSICMHSNDILICFLGGQAGCSYTNT